MVDQSKTKRRRGSKGKDDPGTSTPRHQGSTTSRLVQLDGEKWFDYGKQEYPVRNTILENANPDQLVERYRKLADDYMRKQQSGSDSADDMYLERTIRKGTLKDKIAALSVVVSTDPLSKFYYLDSLLEYLQTPNSRVSQMAAEALEDLFLNSLLPTRKLVGLQHRPLSKFEKKQISISPKLLLIWRFEELVAEKYKGFLTTLFDQLKTNLAVQKIANIRILSNLIRSVPEQESQILKNIVNKLGDPTKKVSSAASHELRRLLEQHSAMNGVVAREVQQFIFRQNNSKRALYNGMIFLNQLQLSRHDKELATELLKTYFKVFDLVVQAGDKQDDPMKSRLLGAILTGVNRAHPYLPKDDNTMAEHIDALFRISHVSPPGARTQSLLLLFQLVAEDEATRERFYRALYSTIGSEMFHTGKHLTMFFNLLYKALKHETNVSRLMAFCKKIFATAVHCSSPVAAGVIFLLNEMTKEHPVLLRTYTEVLSGPDAMRTLDITKREPKFALNTENDPTTSAGDEKLAPGWELTLMSHHFHPSVKKFAEDMGTSRIEYSGDPLKDFALTPFLDKFAYRNPKKTGDTSKQRSVAERRSGSEKQNIPFNDPKFLKQAKVCVEDQFFHQFFLKRAKRDEVKGIVRHKHDETELDALEKEEDQLDYQKFEDYEAQWETDEDEEAFVDSLVLKIMDDKAVVMGVDELDEEDPDMDDWSDDLDGDDASESDHSSAVIHHEENSEDDSGCDEDSEVEQEVFPDADGFMDDQSSGSDDDSDKEKLEGEDLYGSDENDLALTSSCEDEEAPLLVQGVKHTGGTFAPAEDFEELIAKSWRGLKRSNVEDPTDKTKRKKR